MVSKEKLKEGVLRYIDAEIIPKLPQSGKWVAGAAIVLASSRYDEIYDDVINNKAARSMGIVCQDGLIDIDKLAAAFKSSSDKYGKLRVSIPVVGTLSFSSEDIDTIVSFIETEGLYD